MKKTELERIMLNVFKELRPESYVDMDSKIKEDLNIDSLEMFSACIEIEEQTKMEVCKFISNDIITINDLFMEVSVKKRSKYDIDYSKYPKKKDEKRLIRVIKWLNRLYNIQITGIEYITDQSQIICPNHESNYDPFMVILALYMNNIDISNFCCFASEDVWNSKLLSKAFDLLGAIPVFRTENSSLAMRRAEQILKSSETTKFLIHPEGRRTRDGHLGLFKNGAAVLSEDTHIEMVPVCINGTYEVYPYGKNIPKILGRKKIEVIFLPPVTDGSIIKVREAIKSEKEKYSLTL